MKPEVIERNLFEFIDATVQQKSTLLPSEWNEEHRWLTRGAYPGRMDYDRTPYLREIVDRLSPYDSAKTIAVEKGAQLGFTTCVIEGGVAYRISEHPGNMMFLSGHEDLSKEAMDRIDVAINDCDIRHLIRSSVMRKRNTRTGDTVKSKEFAGGSLIVGSANNHKLLRQRDVQIAFIDDFDAVRKTDKRSGSTKTMIEQRLAAFYGKMKLYLISTPEKKEESNIHDAYMLGDQRRYYVPCPMCGEFITFEWEIQQEDGTTAGIFYKLDRLNQLIPESVGYICQACGEWFDDSQKYELNLLGEWRPTAKAKEQDYYSYHLSSLYAPPGMFDWRKYVYRYLEANPPNGERDVGKHIAFTNLTLGLPWESEGKTTKAKYILGNRRQYEIGEIPEELSIADGNGRICMLTCAVDLNGKVDDARIDYEILGWSETGCTYSIRHGSIGTFIPQEKRLKVKVVREKWTYRSAEELSVWPELEKVLGETFTVPGDPGREMGIQISGVDAPGHFAQYAYDFLDSSNYFVVALKGHETNPYTRMVRDVASYKKSKTADNLYILEVNQIKDDVARDMELKWHMREDETQPTGFMNYPKPKEGLYNYKNYFSHYESEIKRFKQSTDGLSMSFRWVKKNSSVQNHFWDVRVYQYALKDIIVDIICKEEMKLKDYGWVDFVHIITGE